MQVERAPRGARSTVVEEARIATRSIHREE
jgi:hypothetical protein